MAIEACLAFLTNCVSEGAKSLFNPITRQISYVFKYQSYIDELKDQVKQLGYKREMVQQPVNHARLQGDELYEGVTDWLHSVDEFISEGVGKSIIDDEDTAKKSCFKGLCPNLISRYKLSKQAAKAAEAAASLVGKGNFSNVSYRPAPKRAEYMQVKDFEAFDSRMKVFQDVMEAVKDDKVNIIGVYGMGGVGKTTLVKQVANQVMEDKLFDKFVMAEITQTPDHHKIQAKLAFDLGMEFGSNENEFQRASRLCQRLKQEKRLLIILDNIWTKLEFDKVGIPYGDVDEKDREDGQRRRTIILTSRSRDLLCNDMNSPKNFCIDALSKDEALQLFEKIVGDSTKLSAFQPTADEIVEKCGGLPVALRTVASALKNKSLAIWNDALNQLRSFNLREIHGMDADVYSSIKLSYDFLESDEAKSLFLLCTLFGEGNPIHVHYLLRYGMGLGLFRNVYTLEAARNRVDALIDSLKASCLLLDGDAEDEAKMHDVIHVVAVSIAAEKLMFNIPNVADFEREMEETIRKGPIAISLPYRDIQELPERLECPQLKLFLLFAKHDSSLQISHLFFEGAAELKVLDFTGIFFSSLPSSLGCLINVQTLCLDGCRLNDITIIGQLRKLEILSFRDSDVKELPLVIGQLTRLQLLDLSNCSSLVVIAPNVISKLSRLEELYIGNSFSQWEKVEGGSNASLAELKGLSKLTTLEIHVWDAQILPQDWVSVELQRYKICIGEARRIWPVNSETSRLVWLHGLENVSTLLENYGMKMLLKEAEEIHLIKLKGVQNVVHELDDGEGFPRLKHLWVERCSEILHIVGSVGRVRCTIFPLLESLSLWFLSNLETICDSQLTEDQSFSNLRIIEVKSCDKLKHLFSFSMAKNLLRLQKVEVFFCDDLEMMVGPDREKPTTSLGFNEIIADDDTAPKVILPSLEKLNLTRLRNIKKLWADHNQGMYCCQNLTKLHVFGCDRMKYLFSYSMVNSLLQLQHLEIWSCKSMEGVVDTTGWSERDEGKLIELKVFPKLHSLRLEALYKLTSFANTGHINSDLVVEFPSLLKLEIQSCSNMLRFISTSSPEDTIHSEMQPPPLFDEKVRLPSLEVLHIAWMRYLRKIWHHQLASESFSKLKNLEIEECDNLMNIFPPLVGIPSSLVNLNVSKCDKIEEIVGHVGEEVKENRIAFSELKVLELYDLPRLTRFYLENYNLEFPSLERVSVTRCPNMKTFSQGILSTPKLYKVQVSKKEEGELYHREGDNLNSTIQKYYKEMIGFRDIEDLQLSDFPRLREIWHGQALRVSFFNNLRELVVDDCTNMSSAIPANLLRCLNNLEWLAVWNCDSLEEVLHLEELNADKEHICPLFPKLFSLTLIDLPKLKRFCNFTGNIIELPKLECLTIENCPDMETFISNSTFVLHMTADNKEPQKLKSEENLFVADQIQHLFDEKVAFPKLSCLELSRLHKVQHLWKENDESNKAFANLESLEIFECSKLQKLVPASWHLENLATLEVSKCHGLINLLTLSTSESLVNLERMKITDCKMMEEIIQSQVGEEAEDCIVFRKLEYLGLDCLPSLTSFCLGNYALEFPSLEHVVVRQCPTMKIFSQGVVDAPKLNKVKPTEEEDGDDEGCWEGNLNDTIKKLFNEMNSKEKIEPTLQVTRPTSCT
ncbi:disease resistance protein At4g27190-like isoform X3 [Citrus sinensis]|uniref:disease resistance protein At4g27190-like isoform X3 n=1 Tax=Citrus sinensis TaxID=2711 RepID=UPI002277670B|nr:disease resistance protein At4g27190-like isoform X3 [Citrus sinensis]